MYIKAIKENRPEAANSTRAGLSLDWSRPGMVNSMGARADPDQGHLRKWNWANMPEGVSYTEMRMSQ